MTNKIEDTLKERGSRYGEFHTQSEYAQGMKRIFQKSPNWNRMTDDQREALDMFANKIGRILNGDPDYGDSWHDIAGYAELVEKRIEERKRLQDEAREAYNKKVDDYINWAIEDNPYENGDYDPRHLQPGETVNLRATATNVSGTQGITGEYILKAPGIITPEKIYEEAFKHYTEGQQVKSTDGTLHTVVSVERSEVLGFCPQRTESEVDQMAPEVCVSRCY